ncbi:MAG: sulfatase [Verrucomicrobiota bacterium]
MVFCLGLAGLSCSSPTVKAEKGSQPNFIIIFMDDLGYGDVNRFVPTPGYQTPELDRMVDEGMKFTDFHAAHTVCSPSRAALLTGRYPQRTTVNGVLFPRSKKGLPQSEVTIAEVLKENGYRTAMVGKWHLGHLPKYLPTEQGFESYYGIPYSNDMAQDGSMPLAEDVQFFEQMTEENYLEYQPTAEADIKSLYQKYKDKVPLLVDKEVIEWPVDQSTITKRYTEKAIEFITEAQDTPFFLYYAHTMPHTPLFASESFQGKTERGLYGDVIEEIDWSVGQIMKTLKELNLDEKTLVVFTSDNGPWLIKGDHGGSAGPLRDGKGSTFEGGQRVPGIFWWPGTIPAGKTTTFNATTLDLMPTLASFAGTEAPQDREIDGIDISAVLKGRGTEATSRDYFVYAGGKAIRIGDWKYRHDTQFGKWEAKDKKLGKKENPRVEQLFHLVDDLGEQNNVIEENPEKAAELKARLQAFLKEL